MAGGMSSGALPKAEILMFANDAPTLRPGTHVTGLDLVRFLAAFIVMIYHLYFWKNGDISEAAGDFSHVWWFGWIGVEIFFVLSGFVIVFSAQNGSAWTFCRRRVLRLAPTVWLAATTSFAAMIILANGAQESDILPRYFTTLGLLPIGRPIDVVYWTLQVEVAFYILIFVLLHSFGLRALTPAMIALGLISSVFVLFVAAANLYPQYLPSRFVVLAHSLGAMRTTRLLLLQHGCFFALGATLWALSDDRKNRLLLVATALFTVVCTLSVAASARMYIVEHHPNGVILLSPMLIWLVALAAMAAFIFAGSGPLASPRIAPTIRLLGLLSFPIYLLHNNCGLLISRSFARLGCPVEIATPFAIAIVLALSLLFVKLLDPFVRDRLALVMERASRGVRSVQRRQTAD
ncbi:acyltransferase family protein [Methylocella sp.]|uniref:acyltransferase family protein n=1 Tax=Methylocella sp. TaxID=1978226 RepID=UPI0035AF851C